MDEGKLPLLWVKRLIGAEAFFLAASFLLMFCLFVLFQEKSNWNILVITFYLFVANIYAAFLIGCAGCAFYFLVPSARSGVLLLVSIGNIIIGGGILILLAAEPFKMNRLF